MAEGTLQASPGQTHIEWKIRNFSKRPLRHPLRGQKSPSVSNSIMSPPFSLSDAQWCVRMHLEGQAKYPTGWLSLYLRKEDSAAERRIAYRIGIKNADGSEMIADQMKHTFQKKSNECGWDKFVKSSTLWSSENTLSSDGTLTIFCTARLVQTKNVSSLYGLVTLSENFKDLYLGRRYSDVTVSAKDKKFFAHQNILSSRSKVFASMFEDDMLEKTSKTVDIPDCNPDTFQEFLLFLYSGREDIVSPRNALSLYETADKYDLKELRDECVECMTRNVSVDSFCDIVLLATLHCETDLLEAAKYFFIHNAERIIKTPEWREFLFENSSLGNELFIKFLESKQTSEND